MTHHVGVRYEARGVLVCESALHIGGWEASAAADLAVARDGLGHPVIPGTSLAGALRAWIEDHHGEQASNDLFGYLVERSQEAATARIRVNDALLQAPLPAVPAVRDGVGIDRRTGSAAAGFLYSREVLPAGTRFSFRMVADEFPVRPAGQPPVGEALRELLGALREALIPVGASRTKGLGQIRLEEAALRQADLSDREGLVAWLTGTAPWEPVAATSRPGSPRDLTIEIDWAPDGPLLVKDSLEGAVVDTLPLTARDAGGNVRLLLPGSSIKGVLRAHAERIVRTLLDRDAGPLAEVLEGEDLPGVVGLFGSSPRRGTRRRGNDLPPDPPGNGNGAKANRSTGWRGALAVADCHSAGHVSAPDWDAVLAAYRPAAGGSSPKQVRKDTNDARAQARRDLTEHLAGIATTLPLRIADHVAIDRWTGGAAEGRLFSVLEPMGRDWQPMVLRLDTVRAGGPEPAEDPKVALALLLFLLRDLADGWLTFGSGGTRGRGRPAIRAIRFAGDGLGEPWSALAGRTLGEILADPPPLVTDAVRHWAEVVKSGTTAQEVSR